MLTVVTSSVLCKDDFSERIERIAFSKPDRIILREKHLSQNDYYKLAKDCIAICQKYKVDFSVNSFIDTARELNCDLHVPFLTLKDNPFLAKEFKVLGVSVHSVKEAVDAEKTGADYVIFGHIFPTDCKEGLKPRGLELLKEVAQSVDISVYAIGGITEDKVLEVYANGAKGICVMSKLMTCPLEEIENNVRNLGKQGRFY